MKLSIITPAYNAAKYIGDLYQKIIMIQASIDIEWIIVNDGSTDNIKDLVESWNEKWISLINKKNGGLGTARTRGLEEAIKSGTDYVWHIDSDDYMDSSKFIYIENKIKQNFDLIKLGDCLLDDQKGTIKNDKLYSLNNFKKKWQVWPQGLVIKASIIPKDFYYLPKNGDISNLIIFDNAKKITTIMEYISVYRVNMKSSMSTNRNWEADYRSYKYAMKVSKNIKNKSIKRIAIKGARNDLAFAIFLAKKQNRKIDIKSLLSDFNLIDRMILSITKFTPKWIPKLFVK